jgi:hypothetical protein
VFGWFRLLHHPAIKGTAFEQGHKSASWSRNTFYGIDRNFGLHIFSLVQAVLNMNGIASVIDTCHTSKFRKDEDTNLKRRQINC